MFLVADSYLIYSSLVLFALVLIYYENIEYYCRDIILRRRNKITPTITLSGFLVGQSKLFSLQIKKLELEGFVVHMMIKLRTLKEMCCSCKKNLRKPAI